MSICLPTKGVICLACPLCSMHLIGRIGFARDGYLFSFDYKLRKGEAKHISIRCTNKETSLYVDEIIDNCT